MSARGRACVADPTAIAGSFSMFSMTIKLFLARKLTQLSTAVLLFPSGKACASATEDKYWAPRMNRSVSPE